MSIICVYIYMYITCNRFSFLSPARLVTKVRCSSMLISSTLTLALTPFTIYTFQFAKDGKMPSTCFCVKVAEALQLGRPWMPRKKPDIKWGQGSWTRSKRVSAKIDFFGKFSCKSSIFPQLRQYWTQLLNRPDKGQDGHFVICESLLVISKCQRPPFLAYFRDSGNLLAKSQRSQAFRAISWSSLLQSTRKALASSLLIPVKKSAVIQSVLLQLLAGFKFECSTNKWSFGMDLPKALRRDWKRILRSHRYLWNCAILRQSDPPGNKPPIIPIKWRIGHQLKTTWIPWIPCQATTNGRNLRPQRFDVAWHIIAMRWAKVWRQLGHGVGETSKRWVKILVGENWLWL